MSDSVVSLCPGGRGGKSMERNGAIFFFRCCSKKILAKNPSVSKLPIASWITQPLSNWAIKDSWCSAYERVVLSFDIHSSFTLNHKKNCSWTWEKRYFSQENGYFLCVFGKRFVLYFLGEEKIDILNTCVDLAVAWKSSCSKKVIAIEWTSSTNRKTEFPTLETQVEPWLPQRELALLAFTTECKLIWMISKTLGFVAEYFARRFLWLPDYQFT